MRLYLTKTQENYDSLNAYLESKGIETVLSGFWSIFGKETIVCVRALDKNPKDDKTGTTYGSRKTARTKYPGYTFYMHTPEEPEGVPIVPQCIADIYESCRTLSLHAVLTRFRDFHLYEEPGGKKWYLTRKGRHQEASSNSQEIIARMHLQGYKVEGGARYRVPLPYFETPTGKKQYLSRWQKVSGGEVKYFASPWEETGQFKQVFDTEELRFIPKDYMAYVERIEEEEGL